MTVVATVLSVPHNGTHFAMHLLVDVLGVEARYQHFLRETEKEVMEYLSRISKDHLIVIPRRHFDAVTKSWLRRITEDRPEKHQWTEMAKAYAVQAHAVAEMRQRGQTFVSLDVENSYPVRGSSANGPRLHTETKIMVGRAAW